MRNKNLHVLRCLSNLSVNPTPVFPATWCGSPAVGDGPFTKYTWFPDVKPVAPVCVVVVLHSIFSCIAGAGGSVPETFCFFIKNFGTSQAHRLGVNLFLGEMLLLKYSKCKLWFYVIL